VKVYYWLISFSIMFISTSSLCIVSGQFGLYPPLKFNAVNCYQLARLTGILCFLFVFVTLPVLDFIQRGNCSRRQEESFYTIGSLIFLQAATLVMGYTESSFAHGIPSGFFYYYGGPDYSWVFIITGNLTVCIVASLYAISRWKRNRLRETSRFALKKNSGSGTL
jgi:hypothetical protein